MKKGSGIIFFVIVLSVSSFAQIKSRALEIYSITEYKDGYVIKAIDTSKFDTLNIISPKEAIRQKRGYEKMIVGSSYNFKFEDLVNQMAAMPTKGFAVRIKTTVVWKSGDRINQMPIFSKNTKGLFIQKKE